MVNPFELKRTLCNLFFAVCFHSLLYAQDYHAVQGSSLAGSLGIADNPASIVNCPYSWDIDVFSFQLKSASNLYKIIDYSLVSSPRESKYYFGAGDYKRFADINFNLNLLNTRIALDLTQSIGFGINLLGYGRLNTDPYNYLYGVRNVHDFFSINDEDNTYNGNFTGSSWLEIFGTYSRTIYDDGDHRLNAGLTMKAMRGVAGGFVELQDGTFSNIPNTNPVAYQLTSANLRYGYSYNFDQWHKNNSASQNIDNLLQNTRGGVSGDFGFEYLVKAESLDDYYHSDEHYFDYDWKIGVAILDVGYNQYKYGAASTKATGVAGVADSVLDEKFRGVTSPRKITDSLTTIVHGTGQGTIETLEGKFKVYNPTRIIVNIDRALNNNFYLNGEISANLNTQLSAGSHFYTQSINFLTLTPRWETKKLGVYLPVQFNMENQFWIGGAFKAGPVLIGVHNWADIFTKNSSRNGGGYIAIVIRARENTRLRTDRRLDCPRP